MENNRLHPKDLAQLLHQAADNVGHVRRLAAQETHELHGADDVAHPQAHQVSQAPTRQKGVIDWGVLIVVALVNWAVIVGAGEVQRRQVQRTSCEYTALDAPTMLQARRVRVECPAPSPAPSASPAPSEELPGGG